MSYVSATPRLFVAGAAAVLLAAGSAEAGLIGVELFDSPDIASRFIDVTYDSFSDTLVVEGIALSFDGDGVGPAERIGDGSFTIVATIDSSGNPVSGTLDIGGTVGGLGPSLITADLTDFGFQDGGGPLFDFVFDLQGGDLADPFFGGVGTQIGVILSGTGFLGSFDEDFDNLVGGLPGTGSGVADTGILIPAPGTLALLILAAGRRRRRS